MILELEFRRTFPWIAVRRGLPRGTARASTRSEVPPAPPAPLHRTPVLVNGQMGFLDHHEAGGWWVQMADGRMIQTNEFDHT